MTQTQTTGHSTGHATGHAADLGAERADLLETLTKHRGLFRGTVTDLTDDQARLTPTVSELCLGGLVKHVTAVERQWAGFVVDGPPELDVDWDAVDWSNPPAVLLEHAASFRMGQDDTLADLLAAYADAVAATDELVRTVDLAARQPLPVAPWFEPGASWSARRVFVHVVAETAQHAGHADIIRETIDQRTSAAVNAANRSAGTSAASSSGSVG
jgi:hypothetical protein